MEGDTVIIGTYEKALVGFAITGGADEPISTELKFTNSCHIGHVLSVASQSPFVASGGDDETIRLLDIRRGVELGTLIHHEGSLNRLVFIESGGKSFLLCASADGTISMWKCGQWECLHALTGHKGAVSSVDVHPSGRFALSVGVDRALMTWNLMKGRQAFITRLPQAASDVKFSEDGNSFFLIVGTRVDVYDTTSVSVKCSVSGSGDGQVTTVLWWSNTDLVVGYQDGSLKLLRIADKEMVERASTAGGDTHKNRIKCLTSIIRNDTHLLISASSDSVIAFWKVEKGKIDLQKSSNIPGRPICITVCSSK